MVLDASVIIAHLDTDDVHHDAAVQLLLVHAGHEFTASVITWAEVLVGPARQGRRRAVEGALERLELQALPLAKDAAGQLAELRAATGLRLPDCCVVWAAEATGGSDIATFDNRLAQAAAQRGITVHGSAAHLDQR
jgi:predicted nucleic acid-binding protein